MQEDNTRVVKLHGAVEKYHSKDNNKAADNMAAYNEFINEIAATENGKMFLKRILAYSEYGVYNINEDHKQMIARQVKGSFWTEMFGKHLNNENKTKIEV